MTTAVSTNAREGVLEIVLDRPKANAIDFATSRALGDAFLSFRDDPALRVAILRGAGDRFFSAGWDLKAAAAGDEALDADYGPGGFAGLTELFDLDKPVIAAVNGMAVGGGFELVLACDLIVAAEHAAFFLPEATLGITPSSGGMLRLPRRLPQAIALEMMLTGRRMDAPEALGFGLVNRVVPGEDLDEAARALAGDVARAAPLAVMAIKEVLRATGHVSVEEGYAIQESGRLPVYERMKRSEDAEEGPRAFAEKRAPAWRGR